MTIALQLYRGYANSQEIIVFGHVFKDKAPRDYQVDHSGFNHIVGMLKSFTPKPIKNASVHFDYKDLSLETKTMADGYFRFIIPYEQPIDSGWHPYNITCQFEDSEVSQTGDFLKPYDSKYGIISDIDDTFLLSHSNNIFKKLYVLLTKSINSRRIFDDVVKHYKLLSAAGQESDEASNSFFFVSSSEYNLYPFISSFAELHKLPKAVIKLKKLKSGLLDFLSSGGGSHDHKFQKIKDLLTFYPKLNYVLLGDDSQKDPHLYERICKVFPKNIAIIYIRQTGTSPKKKVSETLQRIEDLDVETLYYKDSQEAIEHSEAFGLTDKV